jgi:hypothetical protein
MDVLVGLVVTSTKLKYLTKLLLAHVNKQVVFDRSTIHLSVTLHTGMSEARIKWILSGHYFLCALCIEVFFMGR